MPPLDRVIELARERAPAVVLGRQDVGTAKSGYAGARLAALGNPYLEVVGERGVGSRWGQTSVTGTLWMPVEVAGQRASRIAETDALVAYRKVSLEQARAEAVARAVRAYGELVVASERVRVLEELVKVAESEAENYRERAKVGDATLRDTRLAELEVARLAVNLEETRADVARAFGGLEELTDTHWSQAPKVALRPVLPADEASLLRGIDGIPALRASSAEAAYYAKTRERLSRDAGGSLSVILTGGRGELGEGRAGVGVGYVFPVVRRNQGEQARADAERSRALVERQVRRRLIAARVRALVRELGALRIARESLEQNAEPAARAAVDAAVEMQRAGKGDLLTVLTSRRDLGLLKLRRVDLAAREWNIVSELTLLIGRVP